MFANANNAQLSRIERILSQLDAAQKEDPANNRRRVSRHNLRTSIDTVVLTEGGDTSLEIFSRNVSTSGIGFVSRRLCKPGERIVLTFSFPGNKHKLVLAQITFCAYLHAGLYQAGAEFIDSISTVGQAPHIPLQWSCCGHLNAAVLPTTS